MCSRIPFMILQITFILISSSSKVTSVFAQSVNPSLLSDAVPILFSGPSKGIYGFENETIQTGIFCERASIALSGFEALIANKLNWIESGSGDSPAPPVQRKNLRLVHRYLGYSTVLLAGLAALTNENRSVHYACAYSATGFAFANAAIGIHTYGKLIRLNQFFKKTNFHWILASAGAICCATAVISADTGGLEGHSGFGIAGGILMLTSVLTVAF